MKFGMFYFPTDYGIQIPELAPAMEERGIESLFLCEHTHIPDQSQDAISRRWRTAEKIHPHP